MNNNRVFVNDHGLVEIIVNGDQTVESVQAMAEAAERLGAGKRKTGQPVLVLDNLLLMGAVPPEARRRVVELAKTIEYDKLAMVGKGRVLRLGTNLMMQAIGKGNRVKYFESYNQAIIWLKAG